MKNYISKASSVPLVP